MTRRYTGAGQTDYRPHYGVDLFTLDVVIGDRAYGTIQGMDYLRGRGSDFVFRLRSPAFTVYTAEGDKAELADCFEGLGEGEIGEVTVYYKAGDEYRPVRICARRKSGEEERQGRERMEKTNRRKGRGDASERQEAAGLGAVFE